MKATTKITAVPSGKDRHGHPLKPRTFEVDERREDWGDGRTRIFVRRPDLDARPDQQCFAPEVVRTDSIREARCPLCAGTGTYIAHERYGNGGGGNKTVTCSCPAGASKEA